MADQSNPQQHSTLSAVEALSAHVLELAAVVERLTAHACRVQEQERTKKRALRSRQLSPAELAERAEDASFFAALAAAYTPRSLALAVRALVSASLDSSAAQQGDASLSLRLDEWACECWRDEASWEDLKGALYSYNARDRLRQLLPALPATPPPAPASPTKLSARHDQRLRELSRRYTVEELFALAHDHLSLRQSAGGLTPEEAIVRDRLRAWHEAGPCDDARVRFLDLPEALGADWALDCLLALLPAEPGSDEGYACWLWAKFETPAALATAVHQLCALEGLNEALDPLQAQALRTKVRAWADNWAGDSATGWLRLAASADLAALRRLVPFTGAPSTEEAGRKAYARWLAMTFAVPASLAVAVQSRCHALPLRELTQKIQELHVAVEAWANRHPVPTAGCWDALVGSIDVSQLRALLATPAPASSEGAKLPLSPKEQPRASA